MRNSLVNILISLVLATLIVFTGQQYFSAKEPMQKNVANSNEELKLPIEEEEEDKEQEEISLNSDAGKEEDKVEPAKSDVCYKTYTADKISFDYPCDWETNVGGKQTLSAVGTVVAPDGKASFHYPAQDFDLYGMELVEESSISINGQNYPTRTFSGGGTTIMIIEMGTALSEYHYNLMIAYESEIHQEAFDHILETFRF